MPAPSICTSPSKAIEVPKISSSSRPLSPEAGVPVVQTAEQLVEVPTIISYSSFLQRTVEQTIDIPVPHDRGGRGGGTGLQGFSQGQGTTARSGAEFVNIPVPGLGGESSRGGLQGSRARQNSIARAVEQNVEIPARRLQGFPPGQGSSASSSSRLHDGADDGIQGFFGLFPRHKKKSEGTRQSESEGARQCQLIHAGSSGAFLGLGPGPLW